MYHLCKWRLLKNINLLIYIYSADPKFQLQVIQVQLLVKRRYVAASSFKIKFKYSFKIKGRGNVCGGGRRCVTEGRDRLYGNDLQT